MSYHIKHVHCIFKKNHFNYLKIKKIFRFVKILKSQQRIWAKKGLKDEYLQLEENVKN